MESVNKKTCFFFLILMLVAFYSCKNIANPSLEQVITDEDIKFGAFMLKGSDYTAQLRVFINNGELDCYVIDYIEEVPASIDFEHLSTTCSNGNTWEDVVMLHTSYEVVNYLRNSIVASKFDCIEIKVASFSTSIEESINYILYTRRCVE